MTEQEIIEKTRTALKEAKNPLFIIDDDPDGLCAYLVLKKYINKGQFLLVKTSPHVTEEFLTRIKPYEADLIIILDVANVSKEFIDEVGVPLIWIDHHQIQNAGNAIYYNPRIWNQNAYVPTSECAWNITQENDWIAALGIMEDWKIPPMIDSLIEKYPDLLMKTDNPGDLRFNSGYGEIGMMLRAALKGYVQDAVECIRLLEEAETPYDFQNNTEKYELLLTKFKGMKEELDSLVKEAEKVGEKSEEFIIFAYKHVGRHALTGLVAEILAYRNPEKMIIVAREKDGFYRMAFRGRKADVNTVLQRALEGTTGHGGGHAQACGGSVPTNEFDDFISSYKQEWLTDIEQTE